MPSSRFPSLQGYSKAATVISTGKKESHSLSSYLHPLKEEPSDRESLSDWRASWIFAQVFSLQVVEV